MNILKQLWIIILIYLLGELTAFYIPSPLPGNVIGFIFLFLSLKFGFIKEESVKDVINFFLKNLAILFIPGGVGILKVMHLFNGNIIKIALILIISTILSLLATAWTVILIGRIKK
ncbi:MAG: CidA/LrgA family protein [Spirochaetaceae bacterium]